MNFTKRIKGKVEREGVTTEYVVRGEIDHIAIVDDPSYRGTAVWRIDDDISLAPLRIQSFAKRWELGRATAKARAKMSVRPAFARPVRPPLDQSIVRELAAAMRSKISIGPQAARIPSTPYSIRIGWTASGTFPESSSTT